MTGDPRKIERLMALTERLTEALQADIEALERGRPREMRTPKPDVQQLTAFYRREAESFNAAAVGALPKDARDKLTDATVRFREVVALHARIVTRVKNATEGMIKAIADDVAKRKSAQRPYSPQRPVPRSADALIYNSVV